MTCIFSVYHANDNTVVKMHIQIIILWTNADVFASDVESTFVLPFFAAWGPSQ